MSDRPAEQRLHAKVENAITGPSGWSVQTPSVAATYVVNALLHWPQGRKLIAELAKEFPADD